MSPFLPPALVLTAGLGTRLAPLTMVRAKPAVPVAGTPLVVRILRWLAGQGVGRAVLNLHYKPDTITRLVGSGPGLGIEVCYSWEPTILGTAGGPRRALDLLGRQFWIINGDSLTNLELFALKRDHEASGAAVTLAVMPHPAPDRYGSVRVDGEGWVQGFSQAGRSAGGHFTGIQLVDASVFDALPDGQPAASIGGVYDELIARRPHTVRASRVTTASFHDVGTPVDYLKTALALRATSGATDIPLGARAAIDPTATLERTAIWDDVVVGSGCHLSGCIVTDGVRVPDGSRYDSQILMAARHHVGGGPGRREGDLWITPISPGT